MNGNLCVVSGHWWKMPEKHYGIRKEQFL